MIFGLTGFYLALVEVAFILGVALVLASLGRSWEGVRKCREETRRSIEQTRREMELTHRARIAMEGKQAKWNAKAMAQYMIDRHNEP
jgi:hypothetical protein